MPIDTACAVVEQTRGIKAHVKRSRHRSKAILKQGHRWSREWTLYPNGKYETHEVQGHELEATENFARYANDAREEASVELSTSTLKDLPPLERFNQMIPVIFRRWKAKGAASYYDQLQWLTELCQCFEEYHEATGWLLVEMPEDHQREFANAAQGALVTAARAFHVGHENAPLLVLRLADIADKLGDVQLRESAMDAARRMADTTDTAPRQRPTHPVRPKLPLRIPELLPVHDVARVDPGTTSKAERAHLTKAMGHFSMLRSSS